MVGREVETSGHRAAAAEDLQTELPAAILQVEVGGKEEHGSRDSHHQSRVHLDLQT